jgi:hypothetical protein
VDLHTSDAQSGLAPESQPSNFGIELITPKQIILNKDTFCWNLNHDNFSAINADPAGEGDQGEILTVTAICHHTIGYDYYLEDPDDPVGWHVVDCDDLPAPPLPEPQLVAPAPNITAPVYAPSKETYVVVKEIEGYLSAGNAKNHKHHASTIQAGNYYVFKRLNNAVNVTRRLGQPGLWINEDDNVPDPEPEKKVYVSSGWSSQSPAPEPEPEPETLEVVTPEKALEEPNWHSTYRPFTDPLTGEPVEIMYATNKNAFVIDLEGRHKSAYLHYGDLILISGTVVYGGTVYGRAARGARKFTWHSIDMADVDLEEAIYGTKVEPHDKKVLGTATFRDNALLLLGHFESYLDYRKHKHYKRKNVQ